MTLKFQKAFRLNFSAEDGSAEINNQDKTIDQNGTYTADNGYTGLGTVTVNVAGSEYSTEELVVTPNVETQVLTPESDGYSKVTVNGVTAAIDSDIVSGNIKSGVNILGVDGSVVELKGQAKTVSITSTSGNIFTPDSGYNGITSLKVMPSNSSLTVTPTTTLQTFTVPSDKSGYGTVTAGAVTASIDSNISSANIKSGVSILGVAGSLTALSGQTKTITQNGTYTPDTGYNGLTSVSVNVSGTSPILAGLTVTPSTTTQTLTPSGSTDGYNTVKVNAVTADIDSDIQAGNIKSGVNILGVTGTVTQLAGTTTTITTNGTYTPSSPSNGFTSVSVNVTPTLATKTITSNGTYAASSDSADGYSSVSVNVAGTTPSGTTTITANGTYDVTNYASANVNVAGSGGDSGGKYLVRVVDYDGTILKQDHLNTGATFTLPNPPTHSNLTFEEWATPDTITNNTVTVGNSDIFIGPVYTTKSGKCEFDIVINGATGMTFTLSMDGTKDWGDGTTDTNTTHTYASEGFYTITCDGNNIVSSDYLFGHTSTSPNISVLEVRLPNTASTDTSGTHPFQFCYSLQAVSLHKNMTTLGMSQFAYDFHLKALILPNSLTAIGPGLCQYCESIQTVVFPKTYTKNGAGTTSMFQECHHLEGIILGSEPSTTTTRTSEFNECTSLTHITIPNTFTAIGNSSFHRCVNILEYDFTSFNSVPTLNNVTAFNQINVFAKIKVPASLESSWKTATNWATFAGYIVGV